MKKACVSNNKALTVAFILFLCMFYFTVAVDKWMSGGIIQLLCSHLTGAMIRTNF